MGHSPTGTCEKNCLATHFFPFSLSQARDLGIGNSYTVESTFCGVDFGPLKDHHLNTDHLQVKVVTTKNFHQRVQTTFGWKKTAPLWTLGKISIPSLVPSKLPLCPHLAPLLPLTPPSSVSLKSRQSMAQEAGVAICDALLDYYLPNQAQRERAHRDLMARDGIEGSRLGLLNMPPPNGTIFADAVSGGGGSDVEPSADGESNGGRGVDRSNVGGCGAAGDEGGAQGMEGLDVDDDVSFLFMSLFTFDFSHGLGTQDMLAHNTRPKQFALKAMSACTWLLALFCQHNNARRHRVA